MDIVSRGNKACDVLKVHVLSSGNLTLHTKAMMHAMNSTTDLCMRIVTWSEIVLTAKYFHQLTTLTTLLASTEKPIRSIKDMWSIVEPPINFFCQYDAP